MPFFPFLRNNHKNLWFSFYCRFIQFWWCFFRFPLVVSVLLLYYYFSILVTLSQSKARFYEQINEWKPSMVYWYVVLESLVKLFIHVAIVFAPCAPAHVCLVKCLKRFCRVLWFTAKRSTQCRYNHHQLKLDGKQQTIDCHTWFADANTNKLNDHP